MSEHISSGPVSRRSVLQGGAAAAAAAAAGMTLTSCATRPARARATVATDVANVRVDHDRYGAHVGPTLAANPRKPGQLLTACQTADKALGNPDFMTTYLSLDAGATWQNGGLPKAPAGKASAGDDVNVAFDPRGRGHVVATATGSSDADRAMYTWRTDDGGRTFSTPVTMVSGGTYFDAPWIAAGNGLTPSERNVYVVWAGNHNEGGDSVTMRRSTDGGLSYGPPHTILNARVPSETSIGPKIAAGPNGLVCVVGNAKGHYNSSGDVEARVLVICSTDGGRSFSAPVDLGWESVDISLPGDIIPNSDAKIAASPRGDAVYVAFVRRRARTSHSDIVVRASYDSGRTWSNAVVATPSDSLTYFQPALAVDGSGRVAISAFALSDGLVNEVLLLSRPHQLSFRPPIRVTTAPFNPTGKTPTGRKHGAWWIGDWQGIAASAGGIHLVWNDTRTGKLDLFAATIRP
jgi:TAT (twin-arginine translocation) pathway signal sequence